MSLSQIPVVLTINEVFPSLTNMIISQEVIGDRIKTGNSLVNKALKNVGKYGNKALYISGDTVPVYDFAKDNNNKVSRAGLEAEASNLLACDWAPDPVVEEIVIDVFKIIRLTTEDVLAKRAFIGEYAFGQFTSYMIGMIQKSRDIYFETNYDAYVGCEETSIGNQSQSVSLAGLDDKTKGLKIAEKLANIYSAATKVSRDYNDNKQTTKWSSEDLKVIWNSKYVNAILYTSLPLPYHIEELKPKFDGDVLNEDFFGHINTVATNGDGSTIFAYVDQFLTVDGKFVYIRAGELIPDGVQSKANESYTKDPNIICKIVSQYPPVLQAFESSELFHNNRSGTDNRYLRFGHSHFDRIRGEAFITLKELVQTSSDVNKNEVTYIKKVEDKK